MIIIIDTSKCFECGEPKEDMHHVIPKSKGGTKMIPLCLKCHSIVHDKDLIKFRELQKDGIEKAKLLGRFAGRKTGALALQ